ncbi:synaptotagmin-2-like isoform X2 [Rhopilema esculentum]|uniref:synaptotagmin-2-like isoform X2 n=1 Tax=Rhopilema esculentum TaxID=499914 RepID=UPI0031D9EAC5
MGKASLVNSTDVSVSFLSKENKDSATSFFKKCWELLKKLPIPPIATLSIAGAILLLFFICCCCCCCRVCCRRKKVDDDKDSDGEGSVDLNTIELLDVPLHEKMESAVDEMDYSVAGFFDEEGIEGTVLGRVKFSMVYDFKEQNLSITIFEATDLPAADEGGESDPYIRVMLLPDTKRRFETSVLDNTLDPVYNQTFVFNNVPYNEIQNRTLCIQALDFDQVAAHDVLGEAKIPLIDMNLNIPVDREWRILVPGFDGEKGEFKKSVSDFGDICVSLRYIPTTKKLFVYLLECQNLKSTDPGGVSGGKKVKMKKSTVKKQTLNPYYNEQFLFIVPPEKIEKTAIQFMVMDYDLIGKADVIGQVTIGVGTYGPQLRHWRDMLRNPHKPLPQWHMLRPKIKKGEDD